jgi:uncharacterized membrane protein (UPF0127 family)
VRTTAFLGAVAVSLASASCGCSNNGGGTLPADAHVPGGEEPDGAPPEPDAMPPGPRVFLGRPEAAVIVAIADSPAERSRGLMYVQNLPMDDGMLFIFETEEVQSFWMRNTLIPLDMIFIKSDKTVVGVVANAEPLTLTPRTVGKPSLYVLEVNGGWAAAHGVTEGSTVRFEGIP